MKIDMHIHTKYSSDGVMEIREILKTAKERGLDAIAITDHNEVKGAIEAKKMNIMPVMVGIEVSTKEGHVLAYGINCRIDRDLSINETIEKIHDCGGIAVAAHPYRFWSGIGERNVRKNNFDGIEIFNARCKKSSNMKARKLCDELNLGISAGSDAHYPEEIGKAGIIVDSFDNLIDKMLHREVEVFGNARNFKGTIKYVKKAVSEWFQRGFKRI